MQKHAGCRIRFSIRGEAGAGAPNRGRLGAVKSMILGILHSTIRADEKFILEAAKKHNVEVNLVDIRNEIFNPDTYKPNYRIALERSVSTVKGTYAVNFLESLGVKVINNSSVSNICQDK